MSTALAEIAECGIDYRELWSKRVDDWLVNPDMTDDLLCRLAEDDTGAAAFRRLIGVIDDTLGRQFREDDQLPEFPPVVRDAVQQIRILAARCAELSFEPICDEIDIEMRDAANKRDQMRQYGVVVS